MQAFYYAQEDFAAGKERLPFCRGILYTNDGNEHVTKVLTEEKEKDSL